MAVRQYKLTNVTLLETLTGSANITIPSLAAEGDYSVTAQISDAAGNSSGESAPVTFDFDATVPTAVPTLTIADAADGSVSVAENSDGVETNVTLPTGVEEGDTVTLTITNPDGSTTEQTYTVTAADLANGSADITIPSLTAEGNYSITSSITDAAGNSSGESAPVTFDFDATAPTAAPTLTIADAADGSVSVAENNDGVETVVSIPTGVEVGDTVTLTITNPDSSVTTQTYTVTQTDVDTGSANITIPSLAAEGDYSVTAQISDAAGNSSGESAPVTFDFDATVPTAVPTLTIADAADGSVSVAENSDGVETNVTLPTGVEEGDTVTLTITNPDGSTTEQTYTVTAADLANGSADITIPSLTAEGNYSITSSITDAAGNSSGDSAPVTFDFDATAPTAAPTLTIADAADGSVSVAENSDGVETGGDVFQRVWKWVIR
ncbi:Ig-like domain-containing protein [Vibrio sp. SA48]